MGYFDIDRVERAKRGNLYLNTALISACRNVRVGCGNAGKHAGHGFSHREHRKK